MGYIIIPLIAGLALGWYGTRSNFPTICGKMTMIALFLLLFLMGLQLGMSPAQRTALKSLGLKAFALALASITASTAGVWAVSRLGDRR